MLNVEELISGRLGSIIKTNEPLAILGLQGCFFAAGGESGSARNAQNHSHEAVARHRI